MKLIIAKNSHILFRLKIVLDMSQKFYFNFFKGIKSLNFIFDNNKFI